MPSQLSPYRSRTTRARGPGKGTATSASAAEEASEVQGTCNAVDRA